MKKPFMSKITAIALSLMAVCTVAILPGCAADRPVIPRDLEEFSLVNLWNMTVEATGVQERSAELESLLLLVDEDSKVFSLSFTFLGKTEKGRPEVYFVGKNSKGELDWHSYETDSVIVKHNPADVFNEIDRLGLSSIECGEAGFTMLVDFISGDIGYEYKYLDIYQLENGSLLPLNKVVFHSGTPWCTISVSEHRPPETVITENGQTIAKAATVTAPVPPGERTSETWFLSQDISRADVVEYLDS